MLSNKFQHLKNLIGPVKSIGILGYGIEGRSSHRVLRELYPNTDILIMDKNENLNITLDQNTRANIGENYLSKINDCDIVLKSPGIRMSESGSLITSQSRLFTEICRDKIIGITGTKGKSTTATLVHQILSGQFKTALVGNIGQPAFDFLREEYDYYVYEYSCHQLADMKCSPKHALLLNLYPEHLDYYRNIDEYYDAKKNIYKYQTERDLLLTSVEGLSKGIQIKTDTPITICNQLLIGNVDSLKVGYVNIPYSTVLRGVHNQLNQLYAVCIAIALDVDIEIIRERITSFKGLPHRLEIVYDHQNLRYVNDSISTIPQSTIAAMNSFDDLKVVIIGGFNRGIDYSSLIDFLNSFDDVYIVLFSQVGKLIADGLNTPYHYENKFDDAVTFSLSLGLYNGTVLLSPAASSYDEFRSFVERGNQFNKLILSNYKNN